MSSPDSHAKLVSRLVLLGGKNKIHISSFYQYSMQSNILINVESNISNFYLSGLCKAGYVK